MARRSGCREALFGGSRSRVPGLTVRCLGEATRERVSRLRAADAILIDELSKAGFLEGAETSQAFVVLLPVRSWRDGRPADVSGGGGDPRGDDRGFHDRRLGALPHDLLARVANRIVTKWTE